ncbi:hypothetical protein Tco_1384728 [Tanacetum coccineum]
MVVADLKSQELRRTLKRAGEALEPDATKKQKLLKPPFHMCLMFPKHKLISIHPNLLAQGRNDKTFIKVVSDEDSEDEAPILWSALAGWEVISTPLGEINALYRMDQSTKHFTTLREILHMVLIDSQEGGKGSFIWNHQQHWQIRSWRLYPLSNVHVLGKLLLVRYVVPTGKDNFIVSAGRPNMVPAGRTIVSPGSIIFGPGIKAKGLNMVDTAYLKSWIRHIGDFIEYGVLDLVSFMVFGEYRYRYAVSSLMDTAYWSSEL